MAEEDTDGQMGLSFIILADMEMPEPRKIMAAAHSMGIELAPAESNDDEPDKDGPDIQMFDLGDDAQLIVMLMPIPHPDVGEMMRGPFSPEDFDEIVAGPAHLVVSATRLSGTVDEQDIRMSALTTSVVEACNPLAVLKMPGRIFHRPDLFARAAREGVTDNEIPMLICVDVSVAQEDDGRYSFLTHNMERYGRENFYIFARQDPGEAVDYALSLIAWMLDDRTYHLPTGDTVGRTAGEKIVVQRVSNPTGEGEDVIKLELPA